MTDERNNGNKSKTSNSNSSSHTANIIAAHTASASANNNNSATSNNNNNNTNERIIAEAAAKFLLKNGLNGTNAAAAATLLTAAAAAGTFQLPAPPPRSIATTTEAKSVGGAAIGASKTAPSSSLASNGYLPHATTIPQATTNTPTTTSSGNGGSSSSSSSTTLPATANLHHPMAATAAAIATATSTTALVAAAPKPVDVSCVLDYSALNNVGSAASTAAGPSMTTVKSSKFTGTNSSFDMGRHPISTSSSSTAGYGGRLQFFKDGKFILELERSKDGDKGGWVSVPRKPFRTPSAATSATVTPTSAVTTTYPKNENSTSLSFSDDNSSIQSSPWQRDQPWKQSRPRRGISKELSLYYQRPKHTVLTKCALKAAFRKRRRPYEPATTAMEQSIFQHVQCNKKAENGDETLKAEAAILEQNVSKEQQVEIKIGKKEVIKIENTEGIGKELKSDEVNDCNQPKSPSKPATDEVEAKCSESKPEEEQKPTVLEKMNTSEDEDAMSLTVDDLPEATACPTTIPTDKLINGNSSEINGEINKSEDDDTKCEVLGMEGATPTTAFDVAEEKRLKKQKPRAKLNSIIQKLIDSVPARLEQLSKTPVSTAVSGNGGGAISSLSHSLAHKVSPPSSAANRLVEYHHQHVSPRKRILREFEKVSLEDSCINNGGAGGKRSRAKVGGSAPIVATKSSPSRCNSTPMNLAPPQAKTSTAASTSSNHIAATDKSGVTAPTSQPTRLNSSYSIHSLLGGNSGSSSSKKSNDQPATIISNVHHHALYANNANYSRAMLTSPKSPEAGSNGGGKSPSHASSKKRSPPYAAGSPLQDAHTRIDYGRRTPPENYKLSLAQHGAQQLQHSFYAPYSIAPPYSATQSASGTRLQAPATGASSAAGAPHIPHAPIGTLASRDLSPPRSTTASPREPATTPRTVPKKTASIRREFASPTASNSSTATSCSSPGDRSTASPERRHAGASHLHLHRGSPSTAASSPLHYYMYPPSVNGTASPHGSATSAVPSTSNNNAAAMAAAAAAAAAAYIPSVVPSSLYHPYISTLAALRHNPLWVHPYQTGASPLMAPHHPHANSAVASRLSPPSPFHPFSYNGVGAAAVAAAAAAAAFGQTTPGPHMAHPGAHALSHHPHLSALASIGSGAAERRTHTPKLADSSNDQMSAAASSHRTSSSPANSNASVNTTSASTAHGYAPVRATTSSGSSVQSEMFHNSLRNELSSDLPLNLSKH